MGIQKNSFDSLPSAETATQSNNPFINEVYNSIKNSLVYSFTSLADPLHSFFKYLTNKKNAIDHERDSLSILPLSNFPPAALCLTKARTIYNGRFNSSLGPLIRMPGQGESFSFALLYCAHTADHMKGKKFSFTRLYHVDRLSAIKYHSFPGTEFNDLAVAHTTLPVEFCNSHLTRSGIKHITSANIGDEVRVISINHSSHFVKGKIRNVNEQPGGRIQNDPYDNLIQLDIEGFAGDSGAPVLSAENEVIGLIVRTDIDGFLYCNKLFDAKGPITNLYKRSKKKIDLNEIYLITQ